MKDLFLGIILGFIIGVLATLVLMPIVDVGAFAETQNIITIKLSDGVGISEGLK